MFIVLQPCKSFYAPEITSPHSVGEFLKRQRVCGLQPGEGETSRECECVGTRRIFLVELHCGTGLLELFVLTALNFKRLYLLGTPFRPPWLTDVFHFRISPV